MKYIYILEELIAGLSDIDKATELLMLYKGHDWMYKNIGNAINDHVYKKIPIHNCDLFDVYIIYWGKDAVTPYHDHAMHGCVMKVLHGELFEKRKSRDNTISNLVIQKGEISIIKNIDGIHKILNNNTNGLSVSLHIYFPGNHKTNYYSADSDLVVINSTCSGGGETVESCCPAASEPII
jgi:predicted metal-dependent enzyme (double-stranded beta helix superfamily)